MRRIHIPTEDERRLRIDHIISRISAVLVVLIFFAFTAIITYAFTTNANLMGNPVAIFLSLLIFAFLGWVTVECAQLLWFRYWAATHRRQIRLHVLRNQEDERLRDIATSHLGDR